MAGQDITQKPSMDWLNNRGLWFSYAVAVYVLHLVFLIMPFLSSGTAWTLTVAVHAVLNYICMHYFKGSILFEDQGKSRYLTMWEQIDGEEQFTATRKFFTIVPIVLFFAASFYTKCDPTHFMYNSVFTTMSVLPKFPVFHRVRIFGINKY
ncbi:ORM1-like protein 1 [Antedon mediterranea]|uniref:ORM1-like protein 1 n=1 Tax=Antedon mediterranea TaxID=105859 RepID=UPI003AF4419E